MISSVSQSPQYHASRTASVTAPAFLTALFLATVSSMTVPGDMSPGEKCAIEDLARLTMRGVAANEVHEIAQWTKLLCNDPVTARAKEWGLIKVDKYDCDRVQRETDDIFKKINALNCPKQSINIKECFLEEDILEEGLSEFLTKVATGEMIVVPDAEVKLHAGDLVQSLKTLGRMAKREECKFYRQHLREFNGRQKENRTIYVGNAMRSRPKFH